MLYDKEIYQKRGNYLICLFITTFLIKIFTIMNYIPVYIDNIIIENKLKKN